MSLRQEQVVNDENLLLKGFVKNNENTMKEVLSNSIAKAYMTLFINYIGPVPEAENKKQSEDLKQLYENCVKELNKIANNRIEKLIKREELDAEIFKIYQKKINIPDSMKEKTLEELKKIKNGKNDYDEYEMEVLRAREKIANKELTAAIQFKEAINHIIQKTLEALGDLDKVTVALPLKNDPNKLFEKMFIIPLGDVLALVWKALYDRSKYESIIPTGSTLEETQAVDEQYRLETFYNCLLDLQQKGPCHHGYRNDLVLILNDIYKDIHIIETPQGEIYHALRDKLPALFFGVYQKSKGDERKQLTKVLLAWMKDNNPSSMLMLLDPESMIKQNLIELFRQHGTDPNKKIMQISDPTKENPNGKREISLSDLIDLSISNLSFSCDPKKYRVLSETNEILNFDEDKFANDRTAALVKMKKWIQERADFDKEDDQCLIANFVSMFNAHKDLHQYRYILNSVGKTDLFSQLQKDCDAYFLNFNTLNPDQLPEHVPRVSSNVLDGVNLLKQTIEESKKEKMEVEISHFFGTWFEAKSSKNKKQLANHYFKLLDPTHRAKFLYHDDEIKKFMDLNKDKKEIDINPFEVNHVFLHAILIRPTEWSQVFADLFVDVLDTVNKLANNTIENKTLKQDSYPPSLIAQLAYLKQQCPLLPRALNEADLNRPVEMIFIPEQVKTVKEWIEVADLLSIDEKLFEQFYRPIAALINEKLSEWIISAADDYKELLYRKMKAFTLIPSNYQIKFILQVGNDLQKNKNKPENKHQENKDKLFQELLHDAIRKNDIEIVKYLIEKGANVAAKNEYGNTPFHLAAEGGQLEIVKYLIEKGANVAEKNNNGNTPFHLAAEGGQLEIVKYLIEKGANVAEKGRYGNTPLHLAAKQGQLEIVKYLIKKGANVAEKERYGNTPLHLAARKGHLEIVKHLIEKDANVVAEKDKYGDTPLHLAAYQGQLEIVKYLIEKGANVAAKNEYDNTPLHLAAEGGQLEIVKYLIEKGANVAAKNEYGNTPLHLAAHQGQLEIVKYLIEKGANVAEKRRYGNTPLHLAAHQGQLEIVKLLLSHVDALFIFRAFPDLNKCNKKARAVINKHFANDPLYQQFRKFQKNIEENNSSDLSKEFIDAIIKNQPVGKEKYNGFMQDEAMKSIVNSLPINVMTILFPDHMPNDSRSLPIEICKRCNAVKSEKELIIILNKYILAAIQPDANHSTLLDNLKSTLLGFAEAKKMQIKPNTSNEADINAINQKSKTLEILISFHEQLKTLQDKKWLTLFCNQLVTDENIITSFKNSMNVLFKDEEENKFKEATKFIRAAIKIGDCSPEKMKDALLKFKEITPIGWIADKVHGDLNKNNNIDLKH